ncbi:O-antigen ligase family protein [Novosphingobium sp. ZN18A2]|uniref:O-antigen ligase family protein n=1 Tax=Novosphingobium sp. ZN18A2 TaxID=3079861 RepID=UPI0030CB4215
MQAPASAARDVTALAILALLAGGGGAAYGLVNLAIQLAALLVLAMNGRAVAAFFTSAPRPLVALCAASLALPLVQLVPLPPAVWSALPGRDLVSASLRAATPGAAGSAGWFHWTVDSARTTVAFAGLLAPFTVIAVGWGLHRRDLARLAWMVVALGMVDLVVGAVQVVSDAGVPYPENPMPGVLFGTFANRNSTGLLLDCAIVLLSVLPAGALAKGGRLAIGAMLALGVVLTQSRSAMALLVAVVVFAGLSNVVLGNNGNAPTQLRPKRVAAIAAGIVVAAAGLGAMSQAAGLFEGTRIETSLARFHGAASHPRAAIWEDGAFVARRYWPVGVGMGNFDDVFQIDESLETLKPRVAGRAHNDYLEIAIEAGAFGLALVASWMAFLLLAVWKARFSIERRMAWTGAAVLGAIAAQSLLDYPLRNQTMLCVAAIAVLLLLRMGATPRNKSGPT